MSVINISSTNQFSSLLSSSRFVVADFYADWCGPCKAIAPVYEKLASQLSRPNHITFTKVNGDEQTELAQAYSVRAYPTFIVFENGRSIKTVAGADPQKLTEVVRKLASEATKSDGGSGEGSGATWLGAEVAARYTDVTDQVDTKGLDLLNRDNQFGEPRVLFDTSKPSALAGKGKGKSEGSSSGADWVESDTDEQLMLYLPFQSKLKIHSLHVTSLPPAAGESDVDDDELPMRPRTIKLYTNTAHVLGFEQAEDTNPEQTIEIKPEQWDAKTGTATIDLRFVKFQNVTSLVIFFVDGDGESEKLRVDRIRLIGDAGEKRAMGKLEKIGDEPGE
ncbi:Thioredoxin-like protein 1 [Penicillium rolfsii]|nr:Thioredoxin-like protein 1 [Penicillium rolfsii]